MSAMAVSVPKRLFKKAVDRNLLKRRIREAYRLNKADLSDMLVNKQIRLQLIIQYQKGEIQGYPMIEKAVKEGLAMLMNQLKE
jgi:ribonuclease P protein component